MTVIDNKVAKKAIFVQEFKNVLETKPILAPVSTKLVSRAKNIPSPYLSTGTAKAHTQACQVPINSLSISVDELVLDRKIGNAITDCEEELSYANFDVKGMIRADLYASVMRKLNSYIASDYIADATVNATPVDLSTAAKVAEFLIKVASDSNDASIGLKHNVDGATVIRAEKHGKPFVAAGSDAFIAITSKVASLAALSSLKGLDGGNMIETPYGVTVINLGSSVSGANTLIYGTGGAPVIAYREDLIEVGMGEYTSKTSYTGASDDLDIKNGAPMLERTWYVYAQTKGKNGIYAGVKSLVTAGTMDDGSVS